MASVSQQSFCLCLPYAGIPGKCHYNWRMPPAALRRCQIDSARNLKCVSPYLRPTFLPCPIYTPHLPMCTTVPACTNCYESAKSTHSQYCSGARSRSFLAQFIMWWVHQNPASRGNSHGLLSVWILIVVKNLTKSDMSGP